MKRTILSVFTVMALTVTGAALAQSGVNGTAPQGTAQNDPGQMSNNLNTPQNTNPSPANTNGMTTGTQPYTQPTGTAPTTTPNDQTTGTTTTTPDSTTSTSTSASTDTTGMSTRSHSGRLPRTASELPLLALLGMIALSAGFLTRSRRNA